MMRSRNHLLLGVLIIAVAGCQERATVIPPIEIHPIPRDIGRIYPEPGSTVSLAEFEKATYLFVDAPPRPGVCLTITFLELVESGDFLTAEEWLARMYITIDSKTIAHPYATHFAYDPGAELIDPDTDRVVGKLPAGTPVGVCYEVQLAPGQHTATFVAEKTSGEKFEYSWPFIITE